MKTPRFEMWRVKHGHLGNHQDVKACYERAKLFRSEIIDAATLVEIELNEFLSVSFAGCDKSRIDLVQNCILSAEFCTFFQKWRMLRAVLHATGCDSPERSDRLTGLKNLIAYRNAFAHGEIVVDAKSLVAVLHYREGELKSIIVEDQIVSGILDQALELHRWLTQLIRAQPREREW